MRINKYWLNLLEPLKLPVTIEYSNFFFKYIKQSELFRSIWNVSQVDNFSAISMDIHFMFFFQLFKPLKLWFFPAHLTCHFTFLKFNSHNLLCWNQTHSNGQLTKSKIKKIKKNILSSMYCEPERWYVLLSSSPIWDYINAACTCS